ncbi:MAG: carboxypeptidase regulatory-like domain-containing protein [Candidatus Cloacimonetes bacterium]|nr:carboxypeptidase regulatory-like domain-containing protein [Candidatus Cloacimonadota bacterium]
MKRVVVCLIFFISLSVVFAQQDVRGLTNWVPEEEAVSSAGVAQPYVKRPPVSHPEPSGTSINRDEWTVIDSLHFNLWLHSDKFVGAAYDNNAPGLSCVEDYGPLTDAAQAALNKAPSWVRNRLRSTLVNMPETKQDVWAQPILDAVDPFIDEIAFCVAVLPTSYLISEWAEPQLVVDNAHLIYQTDEDLSYVEIVDYGNSMTDDDYYSTTRYWKKDQNGTLSQVEVPRDIYYMYLVDPKITDEIPAYIDPEVVENNSSHNNNITGPDGGFFWRDYLYNHHDEGYPKLKYALENCSVANHFSFDVSSAVGAIEHWISQTMVFTSNAERPHQPVRIYKKHIGRCGEHADLRAAALRAALIPATSILSISGDHTWNEFWDEDWIHYDGGALNNPLLYENGWGKVFGSVFEIRSDGLLTSVTDRYSEGSASITVYAFDENDVPIDGAKITLGVENGNIVFDNAGYTNDEGRYTFIVGEARTYYAKLQSLAGNVTSYQLLVENAEDGGVYEYEFHTNQSMPSFDIAVVDPPQDTTDDYRLVVDYTVPQHLDFGYIVLDDLYYCGYYDPQDIGTVNFMMMNDLNYQSYIDDIPCCAFNVDNTEPAGNHEFDLINDQQWYMIFDNRTRVRNAEHLLADVKLLRFNEIGGWGTLEGVIKDVVTQQPLPDATVIAGVYNATTNASGEFTMQVHPASFIMSATCEGYASSTQEVTVTEGGVTNTTLELQEYTFAAIDVEAEENPDGSATITWEMPNAPDVTLQKSTNSASRELLGYNIIWGEYGEEENWQDWVTIAPNISGTSYNDIIWTIVPPGQYRYAVIAQYSGGQQAAPTFSNVLTKDMTTTAQITVNTNSGDSAEGAVITLTNQECVNSIYHYEMIADESGSATFDAVWKGTYTISVNLENFASYQETDIEINEPYSLTVELNELLTGVTGLGVIDYLFCWDAVPADAGNRQFVEYEIYVDDMTTPVGTSTESSFDLTGYGDGEHTAAVVASYTTGSSMVSSLAYTDGSSEFTDIVAWYPLNGDVLDAGPNGFNGTLIGDVAYASGVDGQGVTMDEDGEYVSFDGIFTEPATRFSVSWWLLAESASNWNCQMRAPGGWDGFNFHLTNESTIYVGTNTGTRFTPATLSEGMMVGEWQHFTYIYDNGSARFFKNGIQLGARENVTAPIAWNGFWIGNDNQNTIDGVVDELRIYERALSRTEVQSHYTTLSPAWGTIEGTVTSAINQEPVAGATIQAGMFSTLTDAAGFYSLPVAACTYFYVWCTKDSFDPELAEMITVPQDETFTLDFQYHFTNTGNPVVIPATSCLTGNYPNPFNPETTICYNLAKDADVQIAVYNTRGQKVRTLLEGYRSAGKHSVVWNGEDSAGKSVASGMYFYRLKTDHSQDVRKMILMK